MEALGKREKNKMSSSQGAQLASQASGSPGLSCGHGSMRGCPGVPCYQAPGLLPRPCWSIKAAEICPLTVLEARRLKSGCRQGGLPAQAPEGRVLLPLWVWRVRVAATHHSGLCRIST